MKGLVLEGGGVRGAYQAGAYMAFKQCRIKFDGIVGTSIGSFNAAMLAIKKDKELLRFWESVDVAKLLGLDEEFAEIVNKKKVNLKLVEGVAGIIKQGGLKTKGMRTELDKLFTEEEVLESNIDYGLVTLRVNNIKPVEIFKEDIPKGKLKDYIIASCYLPVFKAEKMIDDSFYVDGGIFNNLPISMLANKGYDDIYAVRLNKHSLYKKVENNEKHKITIISPSKDLGSILALDSDIRKRNIKMGYYDTLKVLKNYDGKKFYFKQKGDWYYNFLTRKIPTKEFKRVANYFNTNSFKETVIEAMEYILKKEKVEDMAIYNPYKMIKYIKKNFDKKHFIYNFIRNIKKL